MVVATPRQWGVRWEQRSDEGHIVLDVLQCGLRVIRRRGGVSTGNGSGKESVAGGRARMLQERWVCPRLSERDGSAKVEGCHPSAWLRSRSGTWFLRSEKKSQSCIRSALGFAKLLGGLVAHPRRFPGSCVGTPRRVGADLSIGPRPPSGTPTGKRGAPRKRSSPHRMNCVGTSRTGSQG